MKIDWLIPDPLHGSGGYRTILEHVRHLAFLGNECVLHVQERTLAPGATPKTAADFRAELERSFFSMPTVRVETGWLSLEPCDVLIATHWMSAESVAKVPIPARKIYFVQDFEPWFYPMGERYLLAENTYRLGLHHLANSRFLAHMLKTKFGARADVFDFSADPVYCRTGAKLAKPTVAFLYQPEKPHRCPWIGARAMQIVKARMPEATICAFGSERPLSDVGLAFEHEHLGLCDQEGLADIYEMSHVGVCLSATNPSRVPFEMMAAGCAVVDLNLENNQHDYGSAANLVDPDPEDIAAEVLNLLANNAVLQSRVDAGLKLSRERTAVRAFDQAADVILGRR